VNNVIHPLKNLVWWLSFPAISSDLKPTMMEQNSPKYITPLKSMKT